MFLVLLVAVSLGCVHYDPIVIGELAEKNEDIWVLTEEVCEDFLAGSKAFQKGPVRAYGWFGRAREIDAAEILMRKQSIICYTALVRELEGERKEQLLGIFERTWRNALEIAQ